MPRTPHGQILSLEQLEEAQRSVEGLDWRLRLPFSVAVAEQNSFGYLFPALQEDPRALLPESRKTRDDLIALGITMRESDDDSDLDSSTPSAYTYFGQFVDHDITLETKSNTLVKLDDPNLAPLTLETVQKKIKNGRSPLLDLDSVYDKPAVRVGARMKLGTVSPNPPRPPGKDDFNDLLRSPRSDDPEHDREALIGDSRDDENLIVAQLHVAFLRAHNTIVSQGYTFDDAKKLLRRHYQWIVVHDFLKRIADPEIVEGVLKNDNKFFTPGAGKPFMPLEFSVAAYRFGHSMVRRQYDYNMNFSGNTAATLELLFGFSALSGQLGNFETLPENWIIQWQNFVEPLFELKTHGMSAATEGRLAVRNLLRGYLLRLPTGQAVANALGLPVLSANELTAVAKSVSKDQLRVLEQSGFVERTPLWYYILAESANNLSSVLGPVGSTIVAEVLIGLVRKSKDSFLRKEGWKPTLGAQGRFTLRDLLRLGRVM